MNLPSKENELWNICVALYLSVCKNCCELCFELEFSAILNNFTRGHQHTAPTVIDQRRRPSNDLCMWRVVDAGTGAAAGEGLA